MNVFNNIKIVILTILLLAWNYPSHFMIFAENKEAEAKVYFDKGLLAGREGNYDMAIDYFDKAIAIEPGYITAYYYRGGAYIDKGIISQNKNDFEQAVSDFNKVVEVEFYPNKAGAWYGKAVALYNIGVIFELDGSNKEALNCINKSLEANPYSLPAKEIKKIIEWQEEQNKKKK